jgi:hypothetical protein
LTRFAIDNAPIGAHGCEAPMQSGSSTNLANRGIQSGDRSRIRANLLGSLEWSAAFRLFAAGR